MPVPKYDELLDPLLNAMHQLGGSASIQEQEARVAQIAGLSNRDLAEGHRGNRTKFSYRLAWARNYLKRYGLLDNTSRGVWVLTPRGQETEKIDKRVVKRYVTELDRTAVRADAPELPGINSAEVGWEETLLDCVRSMPPDAFERLCQRILRESGFIQVEVTGRSGDGGIDGRGVVRVGGLISFHMFFQCKRFKGTVGSSQIRDFRGAMVGRADKGLLITTGSFTAEARREAQRDGAPPLDLIDGDELILKLKELQLGVTVRQRILEDVIVDADFFRAV